MNLRGDNDLLRQPEIMCLINDSNRKDRLDTFISDTRMAASLPVTRHSASPSSRDYPQQSEPAWDDFDPADIAARASAEAASAKVETFLAYAEGHLALDPDATVRSFLADLRFGDRQFTSRDGLDLMTFHAAKGLEWPIVHLIGVEDGFVPLANARTAKARAEERRLLYVGVTRAVKELHVMWCDNRIVGQGLVPRRPSPWLNAIVGPPSTQPKRTHDMAEVFARARATLEAAGKPTTRSGSSGQDQQSLPI